MNYMVKTEDGRTVVSVLTDKPLTHCVIDAPGVSVEQGHRLQHQASVWLKEGGVFVIGGGDPDRDNVAVMFPGAFAVHEEWNGHVARVEGSTAEETIALWRERGKKPQGCAVPGGVMYANDPEGISHTNHCECSRCESARTQVDAAPHVVQG